MREISPSDALLKKVPVMALLSFLEENGWRRVTHPNDKVFLLQGPLDDEGNPLELVLPRDETVEDSKTLLSEAIELLAVLHHLPTRTIVQNIIGKKSLDELRDESPDKINGKPEEGLEIRNQHLAYSESFMWRRLSTSPLISVIVGVALLGGFGLYITTTRARLQYQQQHLAEDAKVRSQKVTEVWERISENDLAIEELLEPVDKSSPNEPASPNNKTADEIRKRLYDDRLIVSKNRFWLTEATYYKLDRYLDVTSEYAMRKLLHAPDATLKDLADKRNQAHQDVVMDFSIFFQPAK